MASRSGLLPLSSILPLVLDKPRWPQHLGQLATRIGYTPILLEWSNTPALLAHPKAPEVLRWLLGKGASVHARRDGFSSFMNLCRHSHQAGKDLLEMAGLMVGKGACLHASAEPELALDQTHAGRSPLLLASLGGRVEFLSWLVERGADPAVTDESGLGVGEVLRANAHEPAIDWWEDITPPRAVISVRLSRTGRLSM